MILFSIIHGSYLGYDVIIKDFLELYKVYIILGAYFVIRLNVNDQGHSNQILYGIVVLMFISSLVAITQYFNFFNMNELYIRIIAPTQFKTLVEGYPSPRVVGITPNPNNYALFLGIAGIISFNFFLMKKNLGFLITTGYFFIIMNMTKSRAGFIFFVIGIMVLFLSKSIRDILIKRKEKNNKVVYKGILRIIVILVLILIAFGGFILLGPEELTWRLKKGLDIRNDGSFMTRVNRWIEYMDIFKLRLLGVGPTKSIPVAFQVDNEWLILLKEFGVIGVLYFIFTFLFPVLKSKRFQFKDLYLAILVGASFFMMTSVFFSIFQLLPLITILLTLTCPLMVYTEELST